MAHFGFKAIGVHEKHGKLDGVWRDCVIVERVLSENLDRGRAGPHLPALPSDALPSPSTPVIFVPMLKLSRLLALLAAIMLVIGGAPAVAAVQPCNPCPPDCPMMQQVAASADDHTQAPAKSGQPDNPCKQGLACQAFAAAVAAPSATFVAFALSGDAVEHSLADALAAPSRPPDRNLRPPIQL